MPILNVCNVNLFILTLLQLLVNKAVHKLIKHKHVLFKIIAFHEQLQDSRCVHNMLWIMEII